jgi:RHS repeat-associated protein
MNTCPQNYKFEGKERDTETNNDDFGARYYSSVYGRWLSPDWSAIPAPVPYANLNNPQTLNLYAMVSDNPETFADLDGHDCLDNTGCQKAPPPAPPTPPNFTGNALGNYNYQRSQNSGTAKDKTVKPKGQQGEKPATSSNKENSGDHVFIKLGVGLGIGADVKVGPVKVGAEVSAKSEGKYTLSGKAEVSAVKEEEASGSIGGYGLGVGHSSEDTMTYNNLNGPPTGPLQHEEHFGVQLKTPHGGSATVERGSISVEVGVCLVVCVSVGIGVQ